MFEDKRGDRDCLPPTINTDEEASTGTEDLFTEPESSIKEDEIRSSLVKYTNYATPTYLQEMLVNPQFNPFF